MKHLKKLLAVALAALLALCMCVTVFADPDDETTSPEDPNPGEETTNPGSITLTGTTKDKTYELYRIFDLVYSGEGDNKHVSYTIAEGWEAFFAADGEGAAYLVDENNEAGKLSPITVGTETKYIDITDGNVAEFSNAALTYALNHADLAVKEVTEAGEDGTETVDNLPLGYYLVRPVGATGILEGEKSICSLTSTTPDATIKIKAKYPPFDKTPDVEIDDPHSIGDVIPFTLTSEVPDTTGYTTTYVFRFKDTMNDGLAFQNDIKVLVNGVEIDAEYYTIDPDPGAYTFIVTVDVLKLIADGKAEAGQTVEVKYSAKITEDALVMVAENKAVLEYSNGPDTTETSVEVKVEVYTAALVIDKVDGKTKGKLSGATFILKDTATNKYYKYVAADEEAGTEAHVAWVDEADADQKTTDEAGYAAFNGLGKGTYELIEVKAPDGYNKLPNPVTVEIPGETPEIDEDAKVLKYTKTIENLTGPELPETGGIGTTIFYVLGSVLVVGAVVFLVAKKRMSIGK